MTVVTHLGLWHTEDAMEHGTFTAGLEHSQLSITRLVGLLVTRATLCIARSLRQRHVCPFVRLSVRHRYCIKTKRAIASWFLHHRRAQTCSFWKYAAHPESRKGSPSEGDLWEWGGYELVILANFRPISRCISETAQGRTKVTIKH